MATRIKTCTIFFLLVFGSIGKSKAQIPFFSPAYQSSYQSLYFKELPDSMFIYEARAMGTGILFFISFKKDKVKMGYYLPKEYIFGQLQVMFIRQKNYQKEIL